MKIHLHRRKNAEVTSSNEKWGRKNKWGQGPPDTKRVPIESRPIFLPILRLIETVFCCLEPSILPHDVAADVYLQQSSKSIFKQTCTLWGFHIDSIYAISKNQSISKYYQNAFLTSRNTRTSWFKRAFQSYQTRSPTLNTHLLRRRKENLKESMKRRTQ